MGPEISTPCFSPASDLNALVARLKSVKANFTELGNANRLIHLFGTNLRYCPQRKQWLIWGRQRWRWDDSGEIMLFAKSLIRIMHHQVAQEKDDVARAALASWTLNSESAHRINAMVKIAETEPGVCVSAGELDQDPMLFVVENGVVDLSTGRQRKSKRADHNTKLAPVTFDAAASCPLWRRFLAEVTRGDTDLAAYLQRMVGYFLTGLSKEQSLFIFQGSGANGKTVFLRVVQELLGDYAKMTPTQTLMVKRDPSGPSPDLARLQGVRLVLAFEPEEGATLAETLVKQVTGQDKIVSRHLYGSFFEYVPQFKFVLMTNHKPIIRGNDHAIWRRIRLVPFNVTILPDQQDKDLIAKLVAELPGILNWALEGLRAYQEEGLEPPACIVAATQQYRSQMDIIGDWLEDCCIVNPSAQAPMSAVYLSYQDWCQGNGHRAFSKKRLGQRLHDRGFGEARTGQMTAWIAQREEPFATAVTREKEQFIRAGASGSSREGFAIRKVYAQEFEEIAAEAWSRLHRIALHIGVEADEKIANELKGVFEAFLVPVAEKMKESLGNVRTIDKGMTAKIVAEASEAFKNSMALWNSEIDLFANSASLVQGSTSGMVIQQYNAPVGSVQTGERSTAIVRQGFGATDLAAILGALAALKAEAADNEAVVSAIETAEDELAKPEPDQSRISAILSTILSMGKKIGFQTATGVATAAARAGLGL